MRGPSGSASAVSLAAFITCLAGCTGDAPLEPGTGAAGTGGLESGVPRQDPAGPVVPVVSGAAGNGVSVCGADDDTPPVAPGCEATCGTAAGEVQAIPSIDAAYTVMQGRWQFCDGAWQSAASAPADAIGVEFAPASRASTSVGSTVGGKMYYLVAGPFGPQRGAGFAYQLTYDISPEAGDSGFQISVHPAPNSGFWIRMRHSPCPTELEVRVFYSDQPTTMVRFAACGGA